MCFCCIEKHHSGRLPSLHSSNSLSHGNLRLHDNNSNSVSVSVTVTVTDRPDLRFKNVFMNAKNINIMRDIRFVVIKPKTK